MARYGVMGSDSAKRLLGRCRQYWKGRKGQDQLSMMAGEEVGVEPTVPEGTLAKASLTFPFHPVSASWGSLTFVHFSGQSCVSVFQCSS